MLSQCSHTARQAFSDLMHCGKLGTSGGSPYTATSPFNITSVYCSTGPTQRTGSMLLYLLVSVTLLFFFGFAWGRGWPQQSGDPFATSPKKTRHKARTIEQLHYT